MVRAIALSRFNQRVSPGIQHSKSFLLAQASRENHAAFPEKSYWFADLKADRRGLLCITPERLAGLLTRAAGLFILIRF
jgi:hypothetical protein